MKKIPDSSSQSKFYEGIRLYRDDIELILSIISENEYAIQISDKEFQFDSLDELIDKRGIAPTYFEIAGSRKEGGYESVTISFDKRIHIHSHSHDQKTSKIVFARIRDICESRMSKIYKILNPWLYYFPAVILIWPAIAVLVKVKETTLGEAWLLVLATVFLTAWILSGLYRYIRRQVILRRRHEGGFWKQNSDKIWLLILGAVIGIFIKFILDLIWKAI
jgi:hypothetical protein